LHLYNANSKEVAVPSFADSRYFGKWHEKIALDVNGSQVNSVSIRGMSGAPCFHIAIQSDDILKKGGSSPSVFLAGVLIEYEKSVVKFLKFSEIQKVIEKAQNKLTRTPKT
jgi:hypothetical protein